jgi:hypothetical protein
MRSSDRGVWVVDTPVDLKVGIGGSGAEKIKVREGVKITLAGRRLRR